MTITNLYNLFIISIVFSFIAAPSIRADVKEQSEYGIVLLPDSKCIKEIALQNSDADHLIDDLSILERNRHISLYQANFKNKDIDRIRKQLSALVPKSFSVQVENKYSKAGLLMGLTIHNNSELQQLHESVVKTFTSYHQEPLRRAREMYNSLPSDKQEQIDVYGVTNILQFYSPKITLFYRYPITKKLQDAKLLIESLSEGSNQCVISYLAIAKLKEDGNIKEVVDKITLIDSREDSRVKKVSKTDL